MAEPKTRAARIEQIRPWLLHWTIFDERIGEFRSDSFAVETADGTGVLFCGDLVCHDPGGPYRFPFQEGYFDPAGGKEDARRLAALRLTVLCAAHAAPKLDGCRTLLQELTKDVADGSPHS